MSYNGNIVIDHPNERVRAEVQKLQEKKVDLIVLLSALHKEDAKKIVRAVPEIDFILGSYGGQYTAAPEKEGTTNILYCGNRGQRVGESRVFFETRREVEHVSAVSTRLHMLTRTYPNDGDMLEYVTSRIGKPAQGAKSSATPGGPVGE